MLRENFTFTGIKDIVGVCGLPVDRLAGLQQKASGGATKGQLIEGIERLLSDLDAQQRNHFVSDCIEEMVRRRETVADELRKQLHIIGCDLIEGKVIARPPPPPTATQDVATPLKVEGPEEKNEKALQPP